SRVDDENGALHARYSAARAAGAALRRACASRTATAADASRVRRLSARLVNMMGNRAPSTMPAPSALDMYVSCLASMFPASRSGTRRMFALPATGETIFFVCAASSLTALSNASGPSTRPAAISHLAERCRDQGRRNLLGHCLHSGENCDFRLVETQHSRKVDGILANVALVI